MRFDTQVYFQRAVAGAYDATSGDYAEGAVTETVRWASVTDSTAQTLQLVYGTLREGSLTIRLQRHYDAPFDCIRVGDKRYRVDLTRKLRHMQTFVVSEVQ